MRRWRCTWRHWAFRTDKDAKSNMTLLRPSRPCSSLHSQHLPLGKGWTEGPDEEALRRLPEL